jgi:secreted trypsin-like serine protease
MKRLGSLSVTLTVLIALSIAAAFVGQARANPVMHADVAGGAVGSVAGVVAITTSSEYCTGSMIAPTVVLTAAHCLERAGKVASIQVRADDTHQNLQVSHYYLAPGFNPTSHFNDAAVLILKSPSQSPVLSVASSEPAAGSGATITGYGQQTYTSGATTAAYSGATIIQSIAYCEGIWAGFGDAVPSSDFCAQNSPYDNDTVTRGDSGGPLLMKSPTGSWVIAGINDLVVIPNDVYSGAIPQAFGRVDTIRPWIESKIAQSQSSPPSAANQR